MVDNVSCLRCRPKTHEKVSRSLGWKDRLCSCVSLCVPNEHKFARRSLILVALQKLVDRASARIEVARERVIQKLEIFQAK